ncbi:MAG: hypothetical protein ACRDVG_15940, partial [Jatrophihabitantaceae bacterium]
MLQLDVGSDDLVVVALEFGEFLADVLPIMIRDHDIAASNDDFHPTRHGAVRTRSTIHATSTHLRRGPAPTGRSGRPRVLGQVIATLD